MLIEAGGRHVAAWGMELPCLIRSWEDQKGFLGSTQCRILKCSIYGAAVSLANPFVHRRRGKSVKWEDRLHGKPALRAGDDPAHDPSCLRARRRVHTYKEARTGDQ